MNAFRADLAIGNSCTPGSRGNFLSLNKPEQVCACRPGRPGRSCNDHPRKNQLPSPEPGSNMLNVKLWLGIASCFFGCALTGFGQSTNRLLWQVPTGRYVLSTPALDRDG